MSIESPKLIFSLHIPKCAGISLSHFLMELFGKENVLLYYNNSFYIKTEKKESGIGDYVCSIPPILYRLKKSALRSRYGLTLIRLLSHFTSNPPFEVKTIPLGARQVVHGHFRVHPDLTQQLDLAVILREPLNRVISLFRYLQYENKSGRRMPRWFDSSHSIEKFIMLPQNLGTYSRYLNNIRLQDFKFVGITEKLDEFCRLFDPEGNIQLKHKNRSPELSFHLQKSTIELFKKKNLSDYELYYQALDLVRERAGESSQLRVSERI